MIGIIDYGMGNLRSVQKAVEKVGGATIVSSEPGALKNADKIILPGVGAFSDGITQLKKGGLDSFLKEYINNKKPFLGICLGLQLLFESSQEDAMDINNPIKGLNILPGKIVRFDDKYAKTSLERIESTDKDNKKLKIPHMGWNNITWQRDDPLLKNIKQEAQVYFVHSYYAKPNQSNITITSASSEYGGKFTASIWKDNVWGTQFHPEKSQRIGLEILNNFVKI